VVADQVLAVALVAPLVVVGAGVASPDTGYKRAARGARDKIKIL
jgi:hypothetical protein